MEVYIRSDKNHSGNLERLLRSLRDAEYFDVIPLRITIEFDPSYPIHPFTREFLINYNWPSRGRLTIQNPILPESDPLRKAIRFVESFYPVDQGTAVLFLDPNVELSPYYIHWLHYATLEYRYSSSLYSDAAAIYGISLVTPRAYLNGTIPFNPNIPSSTPFLYSAPSAEAALFFPQHWSQFHAYFRRRIKGALNFENGTLPDMTIPNMNLSPDISNSWLLYFTELVKARGFLMLYPSWGLDIPETPNAEYPASKKQVMALTHQEVPSYTRSKPSLGIDLAQEEELLTTNGFLQMLPGEDLPPLIALPVRNLHGEEVRAADLEVRKKSRSIPTTSPY